MRTRLILFLFFLMAIAAFVIANKAMSNPAEATAKSVKVAESEQSPVKPLSEPLCPTSEFNFTGFNQRNSSILSKQKNSPALLKPKSSLAFMIEPSAQVNSQPVSDTIAYLMVFRLLSSHKNEAERKRLRGYVRQVLGITEDNRIEAVFRLADDFKQRILPLDEQINSIKERYHPTHSPFSNDDRKKLEKLKKNKEKIVDDLIADISRRLGANGKDKIHRSIQDRVKPKVKTLD